MNIQSRELFCV